MIDSDEIDWLSIDPKDYDKYTDMSENCIVCNKLIWASDDHLCKNCGRVVKNEEIYKMVIADLLRLY